MCKRYTLSAVVLCALPIGVVVADDFSVCNPDAPPFFSIDPNSPSITDPNRLFSAADILRPPGPVVVISHLQLGLSPDDNIDALSLPNAGVLPFDSFVLHFSVDRRTIGARDPDPDLVTAGFPFNVRDQAQANQAAGDSYMGVRLYTRNGPIPARIVNSNNNALDTNQGDASGNDFSLLPDTSPITVGAGSIDGLNAGAGSGVIALTGLRGTGDPRPIAFSLAAGSPTLPALPGPTSGVNVYFAFDPNTFDPLPFDPNRVDPNRALVLYASASDLGPILSDADDIDALIVFDDGDFIFNPSGNDQIVFSLARGSPALLGANLSAADVFTTVPGLIGGFAPAHKLGLHPDPNLPTDPNDPNVPFDPNSVFFDNVDMLDFAFCNNVDLCVFDFAIGTPCAVCGDAGCGGTACSIAAGTGDADVDDDCDVDLSDLAIVLGRFGQTPAVHADGDTNCDNAVNLADLANVLGRFGQVCP